MKHTPGPWEIVVESHGDQPIQDVLLEEYSGTIYSSHDFGIVDGSEYQLNHPQGFRFLAHLIAGGSENLANARLIAAAPELLEAAKNVLSFYSTDFSDDPLGVAFCELDKAIRKAEGK